MKFEIGMMFLNSDRDCYCVIEKVTKQFVFYQWKTLKDDKVKCELRKVKIANATKFATLSWHSMTPLERELV